MATLFDALYRTLSILRGERSGVATGGSATTLVDSVQAEATGYLNGGTIFVFTGANAGKSRVITSWTLSTTTFAFPTMTTSCASGDQYAAFDARYPRVSIVQAINRALNTLGPFEAVNETITTTDNTESYILPPTVNEIRRVQVATSTSSPYEWSDPLNNWWELAGRVYFTDYWNLPSGRKLRITYGANAARFSNDTDIMPRDVDIERIAAEAAYWAALNKTGFGGSADPETERDMQLVTMRRAEARGKYPVRQIKKDPRYSILP